MQHLGNLDIDQYRLISLGIVPQLPPPRQPSIPDRSPAAASGTWSPSCRVLCTLSSVYLLAVSQGDRWREIVNP